MKHCDACGKELPDVQFRLSLRSAVPIILAIVSTTAVVCGGLYWVRQGVEDGAEQVRQLRAVVETDRFRGMDADRAASALAAANDNLRVPVPTKLRDGELTYYPMRMPRP